MSRMADELESLGALEIKEAAPHAPPSPPWWHEAGFNTAGNALLAKFAEVTKASDGDTRQGDDRRGVQRGT